MGHKLNVHGTHKMRESLKIFLCSLHVELAYFDIQYFKQIMHESEFLGFTSFYTQIITLVT